ncbi:hypothetical protein [Vibrio paucivorans]|uniref:Uncharacterized protein n=8 Tax=Vibrio TaxID=662 RepID=A0A9X3CIU3_9VIBR|nr:hypothetical protein [Vibrio paucivorans]MCW8336647.1 hypothetical protein [Vibrio paucivorans]
MEHRNNSIWYKLRLLVCWIFNLSPIFHISRDKGFDSITQLTELRFSILTLPWGDKHIYLLSYNKEKGFELFSVLKLSDLQPSRNQEELEECKKKFLELDDDADGLKSQLRIEFLKHKHADCQNSMNTLNNKVNSYVAIALVYAGLCTFLFKSIHNLPVSTISVVIWVIFTLSVIFLVNVLVLLRRYLQVKASIKSMFMSFKESPDWQKLAEGIYIDWLKSREEQVAAATLVLNIEKYFIRSIILSTLLLIITTLQPYSWQAKEPLHSSNKSTAEFILLNGEGNFSPQELLRLSKAISPDKKVIFIYSSSNTLGKTTTDFAITALKLTGQNSTIELSDNVFDTKMLIASMEEQK